MTPRRFTPREANQTLPLVKRIVADILAGASRLREASEKLGERAGDDPDVQRIVDAIEEHMKELESIGCSYKDWNFEVGLVDFPAVLEGRDVLLCWRSDEPVLAWYHDEAAGFAGRQPIPPALLEA